MAVEHVNEIVLVGRLSGEPEWRALREDRQVAVWRLIVEHRDARSPQDAIDTIRCVAYDPALQSGIRTWSQGDVIEVRGALRHRFWRSPAGPRGVYEVEAASALLRLHPPPKTRSAKTTPTEEEKSLEGPASTAPENPDLIVQAEHRVGSETGSGYDMAAAPASSAEGSSHHAP
jgi:single-stranded DNA-binding protein